MTARDLLEQAQSSLSAHRLRAVLSTLGIICGIAAVVAALAIGEGARRQALEELGVLGLNNIYVHAETAAGADPAAGRRAQPVPALTLHDAAAVAARVGPVEAMATMRGAPVDFSAGARMSTGHLAGVSEAWDTVVGARVARGRWLRAGDMTSGRKVAVVGAPLASALFAREDPVGEYLSAAGNWYRIVGVLDGGDARAFVPALAMDRSRGAGDTLLHVSDIVFRVRDGADVIAAAAAVETRLRERYRGAGDFRVVVPKALLDARLRAQRATHALLVGVGGLALLISGVGIMNIMLASVAERTQEIGIRRAFGATRPQIVRQFTLEAALLCLAGGAAGLPAGAILAWCVAMLGGWPIAISATSVVLALTLAAAVGLGSGIYPARRAAALDPAAALRAE